jgi:hypothetical protein
LYCLIIYVFHSSAVQKITLPSKNGIKYKKGRKSPQTTPQQAPQKAPPVAQQNKPRKTYYDSETQQNLHVKPKKQVSAFTFN